MTDTNSTTSTDKTQATGPSDGQDSTSGATAQPSKTENAGTKADAVASNSGETQAAPTVSQDLYDRVHADFQAVSRTLAETTAERDELKAYAQSLAVQLSTAQIQVAQAAETVQTKAAAVYASDEEEVEAIKARVHDLLAEAKALAVRLADLVPHYHPGRGLESLISGFIAQVREHL